MSFSSERADTLVGMRTNMRAFYRMVGEQSPDGRRFEREGVSAAIAPSCPHRSVVNAVVYESADALASAHAELRAEYEASDVRAWTVWVPEADTGVARLLRTAGHSLDARPRAMTVELASMDLSGTGGDIEVDRGYDAAALAALNEEAHRFPSASFARVMTAFTGPPARLPNWDGRSTSGLGFGTMARSKCGSGVLDDDGTPCGLLSHAHFCSAERGEPNAAPAAQRLFR